VSGDVIHCVDVFGDEDSWIGYVPSKAGTTDAFLAAVAEARHPATEVQRVPGFITAAWNDRPLPIDVARKAGALVGLTFDGNDPILMLRNKEEEA
jgi:hypothetical protein